MNPRLFRTLTLTASSTTLAGFMLLSGSVARAADELPAAAPRDTLADVVVTARKREESLQQVPVSVAAISSTELQQRSLESLQDVAMSTPNVSFYNQQGDRSAGLITIRGIGQSDPIVTNDPGVGVYLDGVYFGSMTGLDLDMMDVARVEVLRGPQGTLFGKNTIGGAVNIVSTLPSLQAMNGDVQITSGDYGRIDATGRISIPLLDTLAMSVAAASHNADGYGQSLATGAEMGNTNNQSGRIALLFQPSDSFELVATADRTRIREEGAVIKLLATAQTPLVGLLNMFSNLPYNNSWLTSNDYTNYSTGSNLNDGDTWGESLTATWTTPSITVKSITSYRNNNTTSGVDPDASPAVLIDSVEQVLQHQFSEELQLSGVSLGDRLHWVGGLYYFSDSAVENVNDLVFTALEVIGLDASFFTRVTADDKSYAAYGQGTYALTDQLHLTLGLRETLEDKSGSLLRTGIPLGNVIIPYTYRSASWDALSPRISLEDQLSPDVMVYVSAASGFKSGGFNGEASVAEGFQAYGPEKVWTYEAGVRADMLEKRLRVNATLFDSQYRDIQFFVSAGSATGAPVSNVGNAAAARIIGGELEIDAVPISRLTLKASVGLTNAAYTEVAASAAPITTSTQFYGTPKTTATLAAEYAWPVSGSMELVPRADYAYRSAAYLNLEIPNDPLTTQGGYGLVNARVTLRSLGRGWSVAAFGTNLTDKHYFTGGSDYLASLGFAQVDMAPPRMWGGTVEYRF